MLLRKAEVHCRLNEQGIRISDETASNLARQHGIGTKIGARWYFPPPVVDLILAGERLDYIAEHLRRHADHGAFPDYRCDRCGRRRLARGPRPGRPVFAYLAAPRPQGSASFPTSASATRSRNGRPAKPTASGPGPRPNGSRGRSALSRWALILTPRVAGAGRPIHGERSTRFPRH
jgi:hypothetical protein